MQTVDCKNMGCYVLADEEKTATANRLVVHSMGDRDINEMMTVLTSIEDDVRHGERINGYLKMSHGVMVVLPDSSAEQIVEYAQRVDDHITYAVLDE